ncbi:MAG: dienelactone hydrolase family protein [Candidatus Marinimicrobia bacterium]|nr:dienelactone hydrolase family protein [Candidatus Neomarinimicrobiota bacterium]MCF7922517.1 dienelactone hydrolase family protein [Candidatus Neomarinimicrobiota bacterium]
MQSGATKSLKIFTVTLLGFILINCSGLQKGKAIVFEQIDRGSLVKKATQAYQAGNFAEAGKYYKKLLNSNQDDAIVAYNLACCYALQGDASHAAKFVTHAFDNGFRGLDILSKDKDFDPVRNNTEFQQAVKKIEERFRSIGNLDYVEASSLQPYRIRFPQDYDASKSYPLLIGMHGMGGNAEGFVSQYDLLENPQVIFVAPEGQYPLSMHVGPQWHRRSWSLTAVGKKAWQSSDKMVCDYVLNTIKKVSAEYKVSDVYLMGFSQGAVYAYTIGLQNPEAIKGVIGFSGYLMDTEAGQSILTQQDIETGKNLRLYIAHGIDDAAIKVETARQLKAMFEAQGYDLTYTEFEGHHGVKADIFNDAVKWMQL